MPDEIDTAATTETTTTVETTETVEPTLLAGTEQTAEPGVEAKADPAGEAAPTRAAPEKYEFSLPEGVTVDSEVLGEFESVARELGMPQAEAESILTRVVPKIAERQNAQITATVAEWVTKAKAEFGADGKLDETLASGNAFVDQFGDDELRSLLKTSRLGNHPAVIRAFVKAGKAIATDKFVPGRQAGPTLSAAERMYPTMSKS